MKLKKISINTIVSTAWQSYKKYIWVLLPLMILLLLPGLIESSINNYLLPKIPGAQTTIEGIGTVFRGYRQILVALIIIAAGLASTWLQIGYNKSELLSLDYQKPTTKTLFSGTFKQLLSGIGGTILIVLIIGIGLIALIIPAIYFAVKLSLFKYYIAQGYGGIASIKASRKATKGNFWRIIGIWFTSLGIAIIGGLLGAIVIFLGEQLGQEVITIVGSILIGIGSLAAAMLISLINANVFRRLKSNTPQDIVPTRL